MVEETQDSFKISKKYTWNQLMSSQLANCDSIIHMQAKENKSLWPVLKALVSSSREPVLFESYDSAKTSDAFQTPCSAVDRLHWQSFVKNVYTWGHTWLHCWSLPLGTDVRRGKKGQTGELHLPLRSVCLWELGEAIPVKRPNSPARASFPVFGMPELITRVSG